MPNKQTNHTFVLASRPKDLPYESNFNLVEGQIPELKMGQILVSTLYLSIDPYLRGRMSDRPSYAPSFELNQPIVSFGIGKVIESKDPHFEKGVFILGLLPWSDYPVIDSHGIQKIDSTLAPLSAYLGVLGTTGMTAYFGLLDIGKPKQGDTLVVSGAAGAVGSVVGQIGKIHGCHVIGIAGSDIKIDYLKRELGFDEALNYKDSNFYANLQKACHKGIDVYFDNVGGVITDQALSLINTKARIVVCGQISSYNSSTSNDGPHPFPLLLIKRALAQGFIIHLDYGDRLSEGISQMKKWIQDGKIKYHETIVKGLLKAPQAFLGLFKGENIGKQLVLVSEEMVKIQ